MWQGQRVMPTYKLKCRDLNVVLGDNTFFFVQSCKWLWWDDAYRNKFLLL